MEESQSSAHGDSECRSLLGVHHTAAHRRQIGRRLLSFQSRCMKSKEAVLIIVWMYLVTCSSYFASETVLSFSGLFGLNEWSMGTAITVCIIALLSPFAGFVAGVYFGMYKVMRVGLWLMWIGSISIGIVFMMQGLGLEIPTVPHIISTFVAFLISVIGFVAFLINAIPFGLDQVPDASGDQIVSFIHWYIWSLFAGSSTAQLGRFLKSCAHLSYMTNLTILSFMPALCTSVALCLLFALQKQLIVEPCSKNPIRNVAQVLKYAVKHNRPANRSAFTYCEDDMPSKLDLGKSKYGGPFTTEEVEDVKTCLRMTLVIAAISLVIIPAVTYKLSLDDGIFSEFDPTPSILQCGGSLLYFIASNYVFWGTVFICVYELVLYPLLRNWVPTTLRRVGTAFFASALSSVILLVTSIIWYYLQDSGECMFTAADNRNSTLSLSYIWIKIPVAALTAIAVVFIGTSILEFVCAQAPYNLRGMLVGFVYFVVLCGCPAGLGIYTLWEKTYQRLDQKDPSCNMWFYLFTTIAISLGCVVWCCVARWYKKRERDEPDRVRIFVESYYDHYCRLGSP